VDRSSGLIGGGITPFSKEPYVTLTLASYGSVPVFYKKEEQREQGINKAFIYSVFQKEQAFVARVMGLPFNKGELGANPARTYLNSLTHCSSSKSAVFLCSF
jgi:hypothetical protein